MMSRKTNSTQHMDLIDTTTIHNIIHVGTTTHHFSLKNPKIVL